MTVRFSTEAVVRLIPYSQVKQSLTDLGLKPKTADLIYTDNTSTELVKTWSGATPQSKADREHWMLYCPSKIRVPLELRIRRFKERKTDAGLKRKRKRQKFQFKKRAKMKREIEAELESEKKNSDATK